MSRLNIFHMTGKYCIENGEKSPVRARRCIQYAVAILANLSGMSFGMILAWMSPASPHLMNGSVGFPVSLYEISLIGSLVTIGAAVSSLPTGYLTDRLGRKTTLLALVPVSLVGWGLIIWAVNVEMLYAGRFVTGMYGGAVCVATPVFTSEISEKEIRGELGSYFQLLLSVGIVVAFVAGSLLDVFYLSLCCSTVPVLLGIALLFFPETPVYYLTRGRLEEAEASLKFYRGKSSDVEDELHHLANNASRKTEESNESSWDIFVSRPGMKAVFLSIGIMTFQQLCGINAATFYSTMIFQDAGSSIEPKYATVVLGIMQFAGTLVGMFLIDRLGRVILLGWSAAVMGISMFAIGSYFFLKENEYDVGSITWLPLLSLCVFTVLFSVGYGPIPWALMPEITPSRIVGTVCSMACIINWLCAFIVTKFFSDLVDLLGAGVTFWIFAIFGACATIFSFAVLPETKGKSLEEIQTIMSR